MPRGLQRGHSPVENVDVAAVAWELAAVLRDALVDLHEAGLRLGDLHGVHGDRVLDVAHGLLLRVQRGLDEPEAAREQFVASGGQAGGRIAGRALRRGDALDDVFIF